MDWLDLALVAIALPAVLTPLMIWPAAVSAGSRMGT